MRYTCSAKGVVGCTMRAIQFHKISNGKHINKGGVCYTKTDKDSKTTDRIDDYYQTTADANENVNVCYNPPVDYPSVINSKKNDKNSKKIEFNDEQINTIIDWFKFFIENKGDKKALEEKQK